MKKLIKKAAKKLVFLDSKTVSKRRKTKVKRNLRDRKVKSSLNKVIKRMSKKKKKK